MLLQSKFKAMRRPLRTCFIILFCSLASSAVLFPSQVSGQQFLPPAIQRIQQPQISNVYRSPTNQRRVIQNPTLQSPAPLIQSPTFQSPSNQSQIYQGPTYQGRIYQGPGYYPDLGRIIQQPPTSSPTNQAPGQIQTVPPVAQRIQQPSSSSQPTTQQTLDAEQAAYNAEKLALVEKLLDRYKASAAENQKAIEQLQSLKQENSQLVTRMGRLSQATESYQTQILALEEKLLTLNKPNPATIRETEKLKADYQGVINQVNDLESKVQRLSGENKDYQGQIASLKSAQERTMNSMPIESAQAELAKQNRRLTKDNEALKLKFRENINEYTTIQQEYQTLNQQKQRLADDNQRLSSQIAKFSVADNSFNSGRVSEVDSIDANTSTVPPEPVEAQSTVDVSSYETEISQLTRKNRQLTETNSEFENKNRSLNRQLVDLKGQGDIKLASESNPPSASTAVPILPATATTVAGGKGKWGVLVWLIPFLALGLGIAFFVIMREELHRPPAGKTTKPARKA